MSSLEDWADFIRKDGECRRAVAKKMHQAVEVVDAEIGDVECQIFEDMKALESVIHQCHQWCTGIGAPKNLNIELATQSYREARIELNRLQKLINEKVG